MDLEIKEAQLHLEFYTYLGYENGWKSGDDNVTKHDKCVSGNHRIQSLSDGKGDHLYWCDECKIYWKMDSSD